MIYFKEELEGFKEIDLKSLEESVDDIPDDIKTSLVLYNQALESLRRGSEDIAIIELKKAISLNPEFSEAQNLLGLCYVYINEIQEAERLFRKVVNNEKNGIKALNYLTRLKKENSPGVILPAETVSSPSREDSKPAVIKIMRKKDNIKSVILRYVLGFTAGVMAMFIFSYPYLFKDDKKDPGTDKSIAASVNQLTEELQNLQEEYRQLSLRYEEKETELDEKNTAYESLKASYDAAVEERNYYEYIVELYQATELYLLNKYSDAAETLLLIDKNKLRSNELVKYNELSGNIMPKAADQVYEEGMSLWNTGNYEAAILKFDKITIYDESFVRLDRAIYYKGKCYQALEDYEKAMECYNFIIDNFPSSNDFVYWAGVRIREIPEEYR